MKLPLVTTYSNLQLRLGYLKIIAAMGNRTAMTNEAFESKLAPLFPAPPAKGSTFGTPSPAEQQFYIERLFYDLGHHRGELNRNNLSEVLTLGKAFGFLHPTNCSLFEIAVVLRSVMGASALNSVQSMNSSGYNPLKLVSAMERAYFLIVVLTTDLPVALAACIAANKPAPFRLYQGFPQGEKLVEGKNAFRPKEKVRRTLSNDDESLVPYTRDNVLLNSYELIARKARNQLSITNWKDWVKYFEGEETRSAFDKVTYFRMGKRSSFRHHAAPRLEFLVDLGLLKHSSSKPAEAGNEKEDEDSDYSYEPTECTQRFASFIKTHFLEQGELNPDKFVRERVIQCFGETFDLKLRDPSPAQQLEFLLAGYQAVKRDIGTTPMWTVAIMAALLALNKSIRLEIASLYELARTKAQEEHAKIRLSGGSRFDREFLIGISADLLKNATRKTS